MDDVPPVAVLVDEAAAGRQEAWNEIVRRFLPLVFAVTGGFRLGQSEQQDVAQSVWLKLYQNLSGIREPDALPGWISVTTRNEALRVVQAHKRWVPVDPQLPVQLNERSTSVPDVDESVLRAERNQMIRDGLRELPEKERQLLEMMVEDPAPTYREIAKRLNIAIGSIGPLRARYLAKLRQTRAMRSYYAPQQRTGTI